MSLITDLIPIQKYYHNIELIRANLFYEKTKKFTFYNYIKSNQLFAMFETSL